MFKLGNSHFSFPKLIEVSKELLNSYSSHNNGGLESLFNIIWVVGNVDGLGREPVFNHIQILGGTCIEGALLYFIGEVLGKRYCWRLVTNEHVFWTVYIC